MRLPSVLRPLAIGIAAAALLPLLIHNEYLLHVAVIALIFAALTTSWNLVSGYGGMFTFGHQAFFGIGAYASALLVMHAGVSPYLGIVFGGVLACLAGLVIGIPCLRLRGAPYIAIATLAFAEIVKIVADNLTNLTHGESGLAGIPPLSAITLPFAGRIVFSIANSVPYYYAALLLLAAILCCTALLLTSPVGMAFAALRDSQDAAESVGINVTRYKVLLFGVSSLMAGTSGGLFAHYVSVLTPSTILGIETMVQIIAMALIGGLGSFFGPVIGAVILSGSLEALRSLGDYEFLIYGAMIVVLIIVLPQGLASLPARVLRAWVWRSGPIDTGTVRARMTTHEEKP